MAVVYFGDNSSGTEPSACISGYYYPTRFTNGAGTGNITEIGVNVNSAYTGTIRMGVYADTGSDSQPGALLLDAGTITNPGTGWQTISSLSLAVTDGTIYWLIVTSSTDSPDYFTPRRNTATYVHYAPQAYGPLVDPAPTRTGSDKGVCIRAGVEAGGQQPGGGAADDRFRFRPSQRV